MCRCVQHSARLKLTKSGAGRPTMPVSHGTKCRCCRSQPPVLIRLPACQGQCHPQCHGTVFRLCICVRVRFRRRVASTSWQRFGGLRLRATPATLPLHHDAPPAEPAGDSWPPPWIRSGTGTTGNVAATTRVWISRADVREIATKAISTHDQGSSPESFRYLGNFCKFS